VKTFKAAQFTVVAFFMDFTYSNLLYYIARKIYNNNENSIQTKSNYFQFYLYAYYMIQVLSLVGMKMKFYRFIMFMNSKFKLPNSFRARVSAKCIYCG